MLTPAPRAPEEIHHGVMLRARARIWFANRPHFIDLPAGLSLAADSRGTAFCQNT
jgi:hypothetical protein